jgi:hypothetical protein
MTRGRSSSVISGGGSSTAPVQPTDANLLLLAAYRVAAVAHHELVHFGSKGQEIGLL